MSEPTGEVTFGERVGVDGVALIMFIQAALGTALFGLLVVLYGGGPLLMAAFIPASGGAGDRVGMVVTGMCMVGMLFVMFLLFVGPYFVAGWALRTRKPWAHVIGLVMAVISLSNCPFGLIGGVVAFMALTNKAVIDELKRGPEGIAEGWSE